jgi:branched-chain amino acid transport system substrate-binding protein
MFIQARHRHARHALQLLAGLTALPLFGASVFAQSEVRIGMLAPLSGAYSDYGKQMTNGARLALKRFGGTIGGKSINMLIKDDTGLSPEVTRRVAQDMVAQQSVDILTGFAFTPNALAVASLATQTKKAMVLMNAAASIIPSRSPYIVRTSWNLVQGSLPVGTWAAQNGIKTAYTIVADFAAGIEAEGAFKKGYLAAGGRLVGEVRVPITNIDFAPYTQRIKDAQPEGIFNFLFPGDTTIAYVKSYSERGLDKAGIKLLAGPDLTQEDFLRPMGDTIVGAVTSGFYTPTHDSPQNNAFLKAYADEFGSDVIHTYWAVEGYDGMSAIIKALQKTDGNADGDKLIAAFKGLQLDSPRGPITIDPDTRDVVQNIYMRRATKLDGKVENVEFFTFPNVKLP